MGIEFIETNKKQGCPYSALEGEGWKAYLSEDSLPRTLTTFRELSRMKVGDYDLILEFWRSKKNNGKNPVVFTELPPKALKGRKPKQRKAREERGISAKALGKLKEHASNLPHSQTTSGADSPSLLSTASSSSRPTHVPAQLKDAVLPAEDEQSNPGHTDDPQYSDSNRNADKEKEIVDQPSVPPLLARPVIFQDGNAGDASEKSWNKLFNSLSSGSVSTG